MLFIINIIIAHIDECIITTEQKLSTLRTIKNINTINPIDDDKIKQIYVNSILNIYKKDYMNKTGEQLNDTIINDYITQLNMLSVNTLKTKLNKLLCK